MLAPIAMIFAIVFCRLGLLYLKKILYRGPIPISIADAVLRIRMLSYVICVGVCALLQCGDSTLLLRLCANLSISSYLVWSARRTWLHQPFLECDADQKMAV